jgi:hypothetical protein
MFTRIPTVLEAIEHFFQEGRREDGLPPSMAEGASRRGNEMMKTATSASTEVLLLCDGTREGMKQSNSMTAVTKEDIIGNGYMMVLEVAGTAGTGQ